MRTLFFIALILWASVSSCQSNEPALLKHVKTLSSDEMQGRGLGTEGGGKAINYIINQFEKQGLKPAFKDGYTQHFSKELRGETRNGKNVIGIIPGKTNQLIVITAHFDHLGTKGDEIYNGADDNASGTAALFSIIEAIKPHSLTHTLLIAAVDAEEVGSIGAQYMVNHFPLDLSNVALNINLDMIAHNDDNELYVCGTYFYPQLKAPLENIETSIDLKYGHDSPDYKGADNWTYASDHRVFHKKGIPFVYFGVEDHEDYHRPSDTFENINQKFYIEAVSTIINSIKAYDKTL